MKQKSLSTALLAGFLLVPCYAQSASAAEAGVSGTMKSSEQMQRDSDQGWSSTAEVRTAGLFSSAFGLPVPQQWQQRAAATSAGYRTSGYSTTQYSTPQYSTPNNRQPYGATIPYGGQWNRRPAGSANCPDGFCGTRPQPSGVFNGQNHVPNPWSQDVRFLGDTNQRLQGNCVNGQCGTPAGRLNEYNSPQYNSPRPVDYRTPGNYRPEYSAGRPAFF